jgi:prepilin-type N-terminal cleavage/methylation domain-containing protein
MNIQRPTSNSAFTLLELLIVITIMVFISTITVINIFGNLRAASYSAAANDVFDSLVLSHQRSCLDGKTTWFYFVDSNRYVIVRSVGTITDIGSDTGGVIFYDPYSDLTEYGSGLQIFNLETGDVLTLNSVRYENDTSRFELHVPANSWAISDPTNGLAYGIALHANQELPRGFYFSKDCTRSEIVPPDRDRIVFRSDGTVDMAASTVVPIGGILQFAVVEKIRQNDLNRTNRVVFTIRPNGTVHSEVRR